MKKTMLALLLVALVISGVSAGGQGEAAAEGEETYEWQIGFNTVEGSVRDFAAKEFKEVVETRSNGRIQVEIFPAEQLGSEQEMIEMVKVGALDFQLCGGTALQNAVPEVTPPTLPFMVTGYEEAHALMDGEFGDYLKEKAAEKDFQILSYLDLGMVQITNNVRPINEPSDLEGIKMRSPNEPVSIATFQALGASVSTMAFTEVYLALSQGVVDGQFNPLDAIWDTKFFEVQEYLAITNHFYYYIHFMTNVDLWESLPSDIQAIVQEGADAAAQVSREWYETKDAEMLERLRPHFVEITYPDSAEFRAALDTFYEGRLSEMVPPEAIAVAERTLAEYRGR
jgi:tripartite ATP-independent transporter DctP family solute receptor